MFLYISFQKIENLLKNGLQPAESEKNEPQICSSAHLCRLCIQSALARAILTVKNVYLYLLHI